MTNQAIGTELVACLFCPVVLMGKGMARHYRKMHGIKDYLINRINGDSANPIPLCQQCKGINSGTCNGCIGSGCQIEAETKSILLCPICESPCHRNLLRVHLIEQHQACFVNSEFPTIDAKSPAHTMRCAVSETTSRARPPKRKPLGEINSDIKMQLAIRKESVRKTLLKREMPVEPETIKVKAVRCPECGITIGKHLLGEHVRTIHKRKPALVAPIPKLIRNTRIPSLGSFSDSVLPSKSRVSICPRCCGDGGVRGGCRKCDGTGWVPVLMERDVTYKPSRDELDNSRVSNADYLGNNAGGYFRERDGRIGSIPMHDDYSEDA